MSKKIDQIRKLLDEVESQTPDEPTDSFKQTFDLFELPQVVASVVDNLQPQLQPYESAIYWYMFRRSVVETGDVHVRVSVRGMSQGVIKSMRSEQAEGLSYGAVQDALRGLEEKKVIQKAGDTTREGTPYRVFIPDEIQICQELMKTKQTQIVPAVDPLRELDFYNVKENRLKVFERDGYKCCHCQKQLTRFSATLDHIQPVSQGGDNSFDNLATSCLHCNSQRGARPVSDFNRKTS